MLDNKKNINYKIKKSINYKKITISIKRSHQIVISAPKKVSNKQIEAFVQKNKNWIYSNLDKLESNPKTKKHTYKDNDKFLFLGELFSLKIVKINNNFSKNTLIRKIDIKNKEKEIILYLPNNYNESDIPYLIESFYKVQTKKIVDLIFSNNLILNDIKVYVNSIKIQKSNARWGSCSRSNNINFSYRLVMLPYDCVEYVIFHEMGHISEKNHGKNFYKKLKEYCPNYKLLEDKIKEFELNYNVSLT